MVLLTFSVFEMVVDSAYSQSRQLQRANNGLTRHTMIAVVGGMRSLGEGGCDVKRDEIG